MNELRIPFVLWLAGEARPEGPVMTTPLDLSVEIHFGNSGSFECAEADQGAPTPDDRHE